MYKTALIGCGGISAVHFKAIANYKDTQLIAICDNQPDRVAKFSEMYHCDGYNDYIKMLDEKKPDVVHITTPHFLHCEMAVECLNRDINVVLEKPLSINIEQCNKIIEAANSSKGKIGICFQNRYNAESAQLKKMLDSGEFGKILSGRAFVTWKRTENYYLADEWRGKWKTEGGGVLINQSIHTLDLLLWLMNSEVINVKGHADNRTLAEFIEVEDTADILLTFENGAKALFYATIGYGEDSPVKIDIKTEKAQFVIDNGLTVKHNDGKIEKFDAKNIIVENKEKAYWGNSHENLIHDFYEKIGQENAFWINPVEAKKTIDIIMAVYEQSSLK